MVRTFIPSLMLSTLLFNLYAEETNTLEKLFAQIKNERNFNITADITLERNESVTQEQWDHVIDRFGQSLTVESAQAATASCPFLNSLHAIEGISGTVDVQVSVNHDTADQQAPSLEAFLVEAKKAMSFTINIRGAIRSNEAVTQEQWNEIVDRLAGALNSEFIQTACNNCAFIQELNAIEGITGSYSIQIATTDTAATTDASDASVDTTTDTAVANDTADTTATSSPEAYIEAVAAA